MLQLLQLWEMHGNAQGECPGHYPGDKIAISLKVTGLNELCLAASTVGYFLSFA